MSDGNRPGHFAAPNGTAPNGTGPDGTTPNGITTDGTVTGGSSTPNRGDMPSLSSPPSLDAILPPRPRRVPVELGDIPFRIRRDGVWLYRGSPIERKEMVCLFASVLRREPDGTWWLRTPAERGRIEVEDAPFVAVELDWTGEGREQTLSFRTNVDEVVTAGPNNPIRVAQAHPDADPVPYVEVRRGGRRDPQGPDAPAQTAIEARISRSVYYELVALAEPECIDGREMLGVWSLGCFFPLGEMPPDEA